MDFVLENTDKSFESLEGQTFRGLTDAQTDYLKELSVPSDVWGGLSKSEQTACMKNVVSRLAELKITDNVNVETIIGNVYGKEFQECYHQFEAPQDFIQIEQISEAMNECAALKLENWSRLEVSEKLYVLNGIEEQIAAIEHRPACPIRADYSMGEITVSGGKVYGSMGGYSPDTSSISLNSELIASNNPIVYRELIDTVIHEGRHAYQDYNINVCEVHPRHSEVESWKETMGDGKWEYWNDCSSKLGQRLYEQQSVEIDARNFAADVMHNVESNILA